MSPGGPAGRDILVDALSHVLGRPVTLDGLALGGDQPPVAVATGRFRPPSWPPTGPTPCWGDLSDPTALVAACEAALALREDPTRSPR